IDELDTVVIELDASLRLTQANRAAEECLGASRDRLLGATLDSLKEVPGELTQAISDTFQDQRPRRLHDCALPGGHYDCSIQQLDEQRLLLECHSLEWTQNQQELQRLEVQTGLMSLLRRNLGHEIRNPLGGIRGAAQMMAAELGEGELGGLATMIMREVDRIDELIKRFWQPAAHQELFDIHRCLQESLELIASEHASVALRRDYDPSIPPLQGDETAIRQLLLNLLKNAAQSDASRIAIRTRIEHGSALLEESRGTVVRIDIEDDGAGVPDSLRPLLFLPMVTSRREGTGLGLALVQQIAADHSGLVTYAPLEPGSRFSLHLPFPGAEHVRPGIASVTAVQDQRGTGPQDAGPEGTGPKGSADDCGGQS
ncbi:MAG: ATP-binding protein, partial [Pseudomonadota bacterium]